MNILLYQIPKLNLRINLFDINFQQMVYNYVSLINRYILFTFLTHLSLATAPHFEQKIFAYWSLLINVNNKSNKGENKFVKIYKGDKYLKRLGKSRINCSKN